LKWIETDYNWIYEWILHHICSFKLHCGSGAGYDAIVKKYIKLTMKSVTRQIK